MIPSHRLTDEAAEFAYQAHKTQTRRGGDPYINHPWAVKEYLLRSGVTDEVMLAAAWLHDTLEDCPDVTYEQLEDEFGSDVAVLVEELTRVTNEKLAYIASFQLKTPRAAIIKLSDRLHNLSTYESDKKKALSNYIKTSESLLSHTLINFRNNLFVMTTEERQAAFMLHHELGRLVEKRKKDLHD